MKIFGKSFSEYAGFEKGILWLIAIVGLGRLALSLAGVPNSAARWLSVSVVMLLGVIYVSIRVHTSGYGSYKHLLPLIWIQTMVAQLIVAGSIVLAIVTGTGNIFSAPEYSGGGDGRNWGHVVAHLAIGLLIGPLAGWLIGSLILLITKKVAPRDTGTPAAAGA